MTWLSKIGKLEASVLKIVINLDRTGSWYMETTIGSVHIWLCEISNETPILLGGKCTNKSECKCKCLIHIILNVYLWWKILHFWNIYTYTLFYHVNNVLNNLDKRDTYRSKSFILAYVQQCMAISPTLQLVYQLKITANANELMFWGHFSSVMQLFSPYQLQEALPVISSYQQVDPLRADRFDSYTFVFSHFW